MLPSSFGEAHFGPNRKVVYNGRGLHYYEFYKWE
jgi:hypothetical protein